ncbi:hypothetical protein [Aureimonas endophytica]|uniref:hypothetical protein n=1 Tax=Aureimonas endophytica TaxID=2027858 RepID=UPI00166B8E1F|nr:hypothetical protein [Aureimonas endophytica]
MRGPLPGSAAAPPLDRRSREPVDGTATATVAAVFGTQPVPATATTGPATALRSDASARPGGPGLVSRGGPFLSEVSQPARETPEAPREVEDRPHLLATTRGRYDLRHGIAGALRPADRRGPAVCGCGTASADVEDVHIHLTDEGRAYVSGVYRCDSALLCPTCATRRAMEIQGGLEEAVRACIGKGGMVWFVTPTAKRTRNQALAAMKEGVQAAWREARMGAGWKGPAARAGLLGVSNVLEAPWSPSTGWGVHLHALVFFDHQDEARAERAVRLLLARYLRRLRTRGLKASSGAQQAERCHDAEKAAAYCGKLASELAHGWVKEGRKEKSTSVHPFALAARATMRENDGAPLVVPGLERVTAKECLALWREYAACMKGLRLGVVSPGLKAKLGIVSASADDEAGGVAQTLEEQRVGSLPFTTWNSLLRRGLAGTFLGRVELEVDPLDGTGFEAVELWAYGATDDGRAADHALWADDGALDAHVADMIAQRPTLEEWVALETSDPDIGRSGRPTPAVPAVATVGDEDRAAEADGRREAAVLRAADHASRMAGALGTARAVAQAAATSGLPATEIGTAIARLAGSPVLAALAPHAARFEVDSLAA